MVLTLVLMKGAYLQHYSNIKCGGTGAVFFVLFFALLLFKFSSLSIKVPEGVVALVLLVLALPLLVLPSLETKQKDQRLVCKLLSRQSKTNITSIYSW